MARSDRTLNFVKRTFPRNMNMMWVTKVPGLGRLIEYLFFEGDHLICLPRDTVVKVDKAVDQEEQMALPTDLADHFIDSMDYHFIMNFCICRDSMPCQDYPRDLGCLFMGEAARGINPDWGRAVTPEEAKAHVRKCEESGLIHFIGKSKLDTVWLGVGPGEKLLTICNCCPCCCITRGLPQSAQRFSEKLVRAPGVFVEVLSDECAGCGTCSEGACFTDAISLENGTACIDQTLCRGCGRCVDACPNQAIALTVDKDTFLRESIQQIDAVMST